MDPFAAAVDRIFLSTDVAKTATYHPQASPPPAAGTAMQIILRQPDMVGEYGGTQVLAPTTLLEVRVSDLANGPQPGDLFVFTDQTLRILGGAKRDSARLA